MPAVLAQALLSAHAVSLSTSEIQMDGPTATLELRMPLVEMAHAADPVAALLDQIRLGDGHRTRATCAAAGDMYVCRAEYEFPSLHPDSLEVECTLYRVTAPNHVHLLTARQGLNTDQLVFDQTIERGEARFHPASRAEMLARGVVSGAVRSVANPVGALFLAALALASRSGREAALLASVFFAGEWASRWAGTRIAVPLPAHFLEALLALTSAYLAVEILLLPESRMRWLVVGLLGLCHGLPLSPFPEAYLTGAAALQAMIFTLLAAAALRMPKSWTRPAAGVVLAVGLGWFGVRLWR
jgi:hypothetical protein